jgi:8-oxo-dGTP diphosphatase
MPETRACGCGFSHECPLDPEALRKAQDLTPASSNKPFVLCVSCGAPHNCSTFVWPPYVAATAVITAVERPKAVVGLIQSKAQPELVLVISRKVDGGRYGLPGGKVEEGETLEAALVRELREEVGIEVRDSAPLYAAPTRRHHTHVFKVTAYDGTPRSMENETVQWVHMNRLMDSSFCFYAEWYRAFFFAAGEQALRGPGVLR